MHSILESFVATLNNREFLRLRLRLRWPASSHARCQMPAMPFLHRTMLLPLLLTLCVAVRAFVPPQQTGMSSNPLCAVQAGYDRSTDRADSFIIPTLQIAFGSELTTYELIGDKIIQPNAVGMKLRLPSSDQWPAEVFLKQVLATDYVGARSDWGDLRRTLLYARTELRFYRDVLPVMNKKGFDAAPECYYAQYDFDGWIDEKEHATTPADISVDKDALPDPLEKGGWLILECISADRQDHSLALFCGDVTRFRAHLVRERERER